MEQFYTLLTDVGKAKIANATALQTKVKFSKLLVGDSNGNYYEPTETQTKLKNKVWEGGIGNIAVDKDNPSWVVLESVIPSNVGGFTIREVGIEDSEGDLVVIAKYPQTYKPKIADGSTKDLIIKTILEVTNVDTITLKVDPTIILATKKDIENVEQKVDIKLKTVDTTVEKLNSNNKEFITKIKKDLGDRNDLKTSNKDNLVSAINEVFQCGNNVKFNTVDALLQVDKGLQINKSDSWENIINNISKISTGKKWAKGTFTIQGDGVTQKEITINSLGFVPSIILLDYDLNNSVKCHTYHNYFNGFWYCVVDDNGHSNGVSVPYKPNYNYFNIKQHALTNWNITGQWIAIE